MDQKLKQNIQLLIRDGREFDKVNFSVLLSLQRNPFFSHLKHYIAFYNQTLHALQKQDTSRKQLLTPELHFEDYSLNLFTQFIVILFLPVSFFIILMQWNYVKEIKYKIRLGTLAFEKLVKE